MPILHIMPHNTPLQLWGFKRVTQKAYSPYNATEHPSPGEGIEKSNPKMPILHIMPQNTPLKVGGLKRGIEKSKISYTQTILAIMVFRDCNSNILNDFEIFFDSMT